MAELLHNLFKTAVSNSYQFKTNTKKSNQPQWINQYVLELIARRRVVFRREKRSQEWKKIKKKTAEIIKKCKASFNQKKRDKMLACESRNFHKCVKAIVSDEKSKQWSSIHMFPDMTIYQVEEKCADFFNGISREYEPHTIDQIPKRFDTTPLHVTLRMVETEILEEKKPKSRVEGNIFVDVLAKNIKTLTPTIAAIYNKIVQPDGPED